MTREGEGTSKVDFTRERHMAQIGRRLMSAAEVYLAHHGAAGPDGVPAWAAPEKCCVCPAATRCRLAHEPDADLARDPEAYLRRYVAVETAAEKMRANLSIAVRKGGRDLVFVNEKGAVAFGTGKPKQARAATCDLYTPAKG